VIRALLCQLLRGQVCHPARSRTAGLALLRILIWSNRFGCLAASIGVAANVRVGRKGRLVTGCHEVPLAWSRLAVGQSPLGGLGRHRCLQRSWLMEGLIRYKMMDGV